MNVDGVRRMTPDGEPLRRSDFEFVRRLWDNPHLNVRLECVRALARFGPIAEPTLLRLLEPDPDDHRFELRMAVATGLGRVGGEASLSALEAIARQPTPFKSWAWYGRQATKEALLSIEARLGSIQPRARRSGLWEELPTGRNRTGEPIAGYWRLAFEERLRGDVLQAAIREAPSVWARRQVLLAAFEQETDSEDLPAFLQARHDPNAAVRGTVADVIWRFGAVAEPVLVEMMDDPDAKAAAPTARALERIGSPHSLGALQQMRDAALDTSRRGYANAVVEAIETRSRTLLETVRGPKP